MPDENQPSRPATPDDEQTRQQDARRRAVTELGLQYGDRIRITIDALFGELCHHGHLDGHELKYHYVAPSGERFPAGVIYDAPSVTVERHLQAIKSSTVLSHAANILDAAPDLPLLTAIALAAGRAGDDHDGDALIAAARLAEWLGFPEEMSVDEALTTRWAGRPEQTPQNITRGLRGAAAELAGAGQ